MNLFVKYRMVFLDQQDKLSCLTLFCILSSPCKNVYPGYAGINSVDGGYYFRFMTAEGNSDQYESALREILTPGEPDMAKPGNRHNGVPPAEHKHGSVRGNAPAKGFRGQRLVEIIIRIAAGALVLYLLYLFGLNIARM